MEFINKITEMIDIDAFLASLPYMGKGMLGIFIVTAVIVVFVNALNNLPEKENKD